MQRSPAQFHICFLLITLFATLTYAGRFESYLSRRQHTYSFTAPTNYKISWNIVGKRASLGTSANTISHSSLAKTGPIIQTHLDTCVAQCQKVSECEFVQVFQLTASSYGTVVCSLHEEYVKSDMAIYTTGSKSMGGTIQTTYGIRKTSASISTTTSTQTNKATAVTRKKASTSTSSRKGTSTNTRKTTSTSTRRNTSTSTKKSTSSSTKKRTSTSTRKSTSTSTRKATSTSTKKTTSTSTRKSTATSTKKGSTSTTRKSTATSTRSSTTSRKSSTVSSTRPTTTKSSTTKSSTRSSTVTSTRTSTTSTTGKSINTGLKTSTTTNTKQSTTISTRASTKTSPKTDIMTSTEEDSVTTTTYGGVPRPTDAANSTAAGNSTGSANTTSPSPPKPPKGAQLVQLTTCADTLATIPMFANKQYNGSTVDSAYIVQHGQERDFATYFRTVYQTIGENGVVVAPNSYLATDNDTWFNSSMNLAWGSQTAISIGQDAVSPINGTYALDGAKCSTYSTFDALLDYLADKSLFPNMAKVYFVAHSGGANMLSRYSQINNVERGFAIRYILANSAHNAYFTNARPANQTFVDSCKGNFQYPYQLVTSGMPRYVSERFTTVEATFQRWISRDVVLMTGNNDTAIESPDGYQNCERVSQGGQNRRDRNYAWWAYQNILAGTSQNVTGYYGYNDLITNGATVLYQSTEDDFNHQSCIVDGVGHDASGMFSSPCGVAAMTQQTVPPGVSP